MVVVFRRDRGDLALEALDHVVGDDLAAGEHERQNDDDEHGACNPLVSGAVDPQSGQPEFKHTPARIRATPFIGFTVASA